MSLNQRLRGAQRQRRSLWHQSHPPKDISPTTPVYLELEPERVSDLELGTAETLRRTQAELQWYRQLYEQTPAVYFSLDATGIILSVNQFGATCLGYTPEQLTHKSVFDLFEESDQQQLSNAFMRTLTAAPQGQTASWEFRLNCPASKVVWVKVMMRLLPSGDKNFVSPVNQGLVAINERISPAQSPQKNSLILMVCEDITAYKQAEVKAEELTALAVQQSQAVVQTHLEEMAGLNRLKEEFLNTVSHELLTPLANMKMAIQMLGITLHREQNFLSAMAKPQAERSKAPRYFEILDNECEREINLINNFLDLQRLDTNVKPWVLETIQVQQWLWRVVELFKSRNHHACRQNLHLHIAPNLPPLACDPFSLERIFVELLTNACKFSPPDAEITVSARLIPDNIQFQVINSGVEIPHSELPRIFDKFYRIPSNEPWKQGGTGLGLALVQKLIQHLGGTVEVESESNLTCFTIQLGLKNQG
ncbi:ATP-binding protein [Nostoc sp. CCY0012]|uniref:PAS domain-containing sensor histidine kinase n=1 Tax=Nostoc sp. CCY0012 TaxID=1056123 RepID=UPI0039C5E860